MQHESFQHMDAEGQRYWWYRGKQDFIRQLTRHTTIEPESHVLDLGCGTGTLLEFLGQWGNVIGMEVSENALILAKTKNNNPLVRASTAQIPFKPGSFSMVAMFDCLEHFKDDYKALVQVRKLLKPNGVLIVSVPAFRMLSSWRDIQLDHARRYTKKQLFDVLSQAEFRVEKQVYGYLCLFFPLLIKAFKDKLVKTPEKFSSDIKVLSEPWNSYLAAWLRIEAWLTANIGLPFGSSIFSLARPMDIDKS